MAKLSAHEPLLSNGEVGHGCSKSSSFLPTLVNLVLKCLMWAFFIIWVAVIFFNPTKALHNLLDKWIKLTEGSIFGFTGSIFLGFSGPILIIAFLAFIYVIAFPRDNFEKKNHKFPRFRLWTFPVLIDGPFGVVSAAELIGILLFSTYVIWNIISYIIQGRDKISRSSLSSVEKSIYMMEVVGVRLGSIGLFCLAFLFLPVARGSILLRLIDIPFEHATRYHVWLGHLTMVIFTSHGLFFLISWSLQGNLHHKMDPNVSLRVGVEMFSPTSVTTREFHVFILIFLLLPSRLLFGRRRNTNIQTWNSRVVTDAGLNISTPAKVAIRKNMILEWKDIGVANLPGVISLTAGLLMWVTSLHPMRKNYFELFFYTHQLYVIFIVFLALHVGDFVFSIAAGAIFIFVLDRFLRFCQSRTKVDVISAACRPCGTVELILSKPANLQYNALSFIFVHVRELSWLQWHPFSVSSSPLEGRHHISILIKVLGEWTEKLRNAILNIKSQRLTVSVEGPYGHESPYHLTYENLILVAGGIGVSPFLAILSDILNRIRENKPCLPRNVLVVWAVKKSKELSLLSAVNAQPISSSDSDKMHLDIQTYVTQESEPSLEEGMLDGSMDCSSFSVSHGNSMSCVVGTGSTVWSGLYFSISTLGFIAFFGLMEIYYIKPFKVTAWWYKGLLFTLCMVMSVVILGGIVIFFWHKWEKRCSSYEKLTVHDEDSSLLQDKRPVLDEANKANLASLQTVRYGCRPDFEAIFNSFSDRVGHVDVGVIVCGPPGLQSSVAKECRSQNMTGKCNRPVFHFNSHSFDL